MVTGTFCRQPAESIAYGDRTKSSIGFFLAQLVSHQRSTAEVRKVLFSRITFTRFVKALREFSPVCPYDLAVKSFKIWGKMPFSPALEPLGKDMKTLWTKNSEVEKQSISVGSGTEQVSLCGCFSLRAA